MNLFFNSLLYYSRIPVPFKVECSAEILSRALRYLPLVGLIVGAIGWAAFWLASSFLPHEVAIVVAIVAMVLSTGGLHEDGFADFCDGFGGGYDKEAVLRIMKDSCVGCYGVIGLILVFMLRYMLLSSLDSSDMNMALVLIISQGASRFAPVALVHTSTYVRVESAKSAQSSLGISVWGVGVAKLFSIAPMLIIGWQFTAAYICVIALTYLIFRAYLHRRIGGFTGDTLGALQIIGEILFYVTLLGVNALL